MTICVCFGAFVFRLLENGGLEEETSKICNLFLEIKGGSDQANSQDVCMDDIPIVDLFVQVNIFLPNIDIVDDAMIG